MLTSAQIRQSFLDFFREKEHAIVPSSSLLPDSPNLLFTNAGMNQFVPIFLGQAPCPYRPARAADTQKCIRAGGKHNDLEDVGLDTYHHTFFEMLGNWSFGDYFKKEAIDWAWELVIERWKFPPQRLYATIYNPDKSAGDPSARDDEAWQCWAGKFRGAGLDPAVHIVNGNKKDNFWMMGDTGPCGPCSELHVDLTPEADTHGRLVNAGDPRCIEIWNLVFIQFNANSDGTFSPLPARHVDTGMGFERVTSIIQGTKGFTDFSGNISNYETDVFRPIFAALEALSGRKYASTLPQAGADGQSCARSSQEETDIAFRVIADHIRTLAFAIADGIEPANTDRHYVLRRILRRAVRYGRALDLREPFLHKLVEVLVRTMGAVFPELPARRAHVEKVIAGEEEAFSRTLDRGISLFEAEAARFASKGGEKGAAIFSGEFAFKLYDTYGFPLDLTQLMARERGLSVDVASFAKEMEKQRTQARKAQKKQVIELSELASEEPTIFSGYDVLSTEAKVLEVALARKQTTLVLDRTTAYAEMGGQVGDTGQFSARGKIWRIVNTQKTGQTWLHFLADSEAAQMESAESPGLPQRGDDGTIRVDLDRRRAIERHHTVTHLLHWALHEVVSRDARQKGSFVGPEKLTFDFNSASLSAAQVRDVERLVNERVLENASVSWCELPYTEVKAREDVIQFFGDKYGERVRVVQIGGTARQLDGYSMELCAGTHTRATGEIGLFRIVAESAIAAGVRRIEAVAGLNAYEAAQAEGERLKQIAARLGTPLPEFEKKLEAMLIQQKALENQLESLGKKQAAQLAAALLENKKSISGGTAIIEELPGATGDEIEAVADALKGRFEGVVILAGTAGNSVSFVATVPPALTSKYNAGKIIQTITPIVGGKGGGRPEAARGAGKDVGKTAEALARAKTLLD